MFRELKEYQEIQKIYEESVYPNLEEKVIVDALTEQDFTLEELEYIIENIDEVLTDIYVTESVEQQQLDEFAKAVIPLAKRMAQGFAKNVNKIPVKNRLGGGGIQKTIQKGKDLLKTGTDKIKPFMKGAKEKFKTVVNKIKPVVTKNKTAVGSVGALGAVTAAGVANRMNASTNKDIKTGGTGMSNIPKKEGDAVINSKKINPDFGKPGGASTDTSSEIESSASEFKANEGGKVNQRFKKDVQIVRNSQMTGKQRAQEMAKKRIADKKAGTYQKPKTAQELAKERIKSKEAGTYKKPKTAQELAKERIAAKKRLSDANIKVEDYTPYDIVLEYLLSSKQAATIEEANYIMTEMDAKTIQSIVSD